MTLLRAVLMVLFFPLLINLLSGKYGRILVIDFLFLLHLAWMTLALFVDNPGRAIEQAGATGLEFVGGYLIGRAYVRSQEDFVALIKALVLIALLLLPFSIMELSSGRAYLLSFMGYIPGFNPIVDLFWEPRMGMNRVQSVFINPIHYGLFGTIVFVLCFVGLAGVYSTTTRWIISGLIGFGALLSLSSGAILAMLLQGFVIIWAWTFQKTEHRWTILFVVLALMYIAIDLASNRTPIRVFMSYATFSAHTAYFRAAIFDHGMISVWAHPIFGIGMGDWIRPIWMRSGSVDNFWLLIAMRYGIPGFAFLALGYVVALWKIGRRNFPAATQIWRLRRAWMFCFTGLTFTLCTVHIWHNIYSLVFFFFGAGMWLITATPSSEEEKETSEGAHEKQAETYRQRDRAKPIYTRFPKTTPQPK